MESEQKELEIRESPINRSIFDELEEYPRARVHSDFKDQSEHPSYNDFQMLYHIVCQERYMKSWCDIEAQLQKELNMLMAHMENAFEAALFTRHMSYTSLWPPLHSRREIISTHKNIERNFSRKQQQRLNYLMNTKIT